MQTIDGPLSCSECGFLCSASDDSGTFADRLTAGRRNPDGNYNRTHHYIRKAYPLWQQLYRQLSLDSNVHLEGYKQKEFAEAPLFLGEENGLPRDAEDTAKTPYSVLHEAINEIAPPPGPVSNNNTTTTTTTTRLVLRVTKANAKTAKKTKVWNSVLWFTVGVNRSSNRKKANLKTRRYKLRRETVCHGKLVSSVKVRNSSKMDNLRSWPTLSSGGGGVAATAAPFYHHQRGDWASVVKQRYFESSSSSAADHHKASKRAEETASLQLKASLVVTKTKRVPEKKNHHGGGARLPATKAQLPNDKEDDEGSCCRAATKPLLGDTEDDDGGSCCRVAKKQEAPEGSDASEEASGPDGKVPVGSSADQSEAKESSSKSVRVDEETGDGQGNEEDHQGGAKEEEEPPGLNVNVISVKQEGDSLDIDAEVADGGGGGLSAGGKILHLTARNILNTETELSIFSGRKTVAQSFRTRLLKVRSRKCSSSEEGGGRQQEEEEDIGEANGLAVSLGRDGDGENVVIICKISKKAAAPAAEDKAEKGLPQLEMPRSVDVEKGQRETTVTQSLDVAEEPARGRNAAHKAPQAKPSRTKGFKHEGAAGAATSCVPVTSWKRRPHASPSLSKYRWIAPPRKETKQQQGGGTQLAGAATDSRKVARGRGALIKSATFTNSNLDADRSYVMADGMKVVFGPNAVNTPCCKAKALKEPPQKASGGDHKAPTCEVRYVEEAWRSQHGYYGQQQQQQPVFFLPRKEASRANSVYPYLCRGPHFVGAFGDQEKQ